MLENTYTFMLADPAWMKEGDIIYAVNRVDKRYAETQFAPYAELGEIVRIYIFEHGAGLVIRDRYDLKERQLTLSRGLHLIRRLESGDK